MQISDHAFERLYPNYPHAGYADIVKALSEANAVSPGLVTALTARANPRETNSIYVVHPDYQGIFVLDAEWPKLITFLRLSPMQWAHLALEKEGTQPVVQQEPVAPKDWTKQTSEEKAAHRKRRAARRKGSLWSPQADTLYRSTSGRVFIGEVNPIGCTAVHFTARAGESRINGCVVPGSIVRTEMWEMERLRLEIAGVHNDNAFVVRP